MNNAKKSVAKRLLAMCLSILMLFSVVPVSPIASATEETTEPQASFDFIVTDGTNPVPGASVEVKYDEVDFEETVKTNEDGIAEFTSIASFTETYGDLLTEDEIIFSYTVSATGYEIVTGEFDPAQSGGWDGEKEITLSKVPEKIPGEAYEITPYTGAYDGEEHDAATVVVKEGYKVEYKVGDNGYTAEVPVIENAGELKFSIKISKDGYIDEIIEVTATVSKADRDFGFKETDPKNLIYSPDGVKYKNVASSKDERGEIIYSVDNDEIAAIDPQTGELTFNKIGTVEVTATMAESENYKESVAKYKVTLVAADRDFGFTNDSPTITYKPNDVFINEIENKENVGEIDYDIYSQERDGEPVDDIAVIDKKTGRLSINASGTVVVVAKVSKAGNYNEDTATYTLVIEKAEQSMFSFTEGDKIDLPYKGEYNNSLQGGQSEGKITYEVINEEVTAGNSAVTVDKDGTVFADGIGSATIVATKAGDIRYKAATAEYNVTTVKAEQEKFTLGDDITVYYGTKDITVEAEGSENDIDTVYSLVFPEDSEEIAQIDENTGKITFADKKTGTFTLVAENPGDLFYKEVKDECLVTVEEKDFSLYSRTEATSGENGWYTSDYKIIPSEGYKIGHNNSFGDDVEWLDAIVVSEEGIKNGFTYFIKEIESGYISKDLSAPIVKIDKTAPTLNIEYSEHVFKGLNKLFYKDSMTVTVTSEENGSGVQKLLYCYDGENIKEEEMTPDDSTGLYTYKFDIDPEYNGKVIANVIDIAGNAAEDELVGDEDNTEIVVDSIAPNVTVQEKNTGIEKGKFLNGTKEITITVEEKNYYPEDVNVTLLRRYNHEENFTDISSDVVFSATDAENTYIAVINFTEDADYKFDISYTDKSGNVYDDYDELDFTIDTINPKVDLTYEDEDKLDSYNHNRKAIIQVNEHNFDPEGIDFDISGQITVEDGTVSPVELADYQSQLINAEWSHNGDIHTAVINITEEARYSVKLSCTDMAGNVSNVKEDSFNIDMTAPLNLSISYNDPENIFEEILWFYKDSIEVTISAFDAVSGLESFEYSCIDDSVENIDLLDQTAIPDNDGKVTFTIPAQFRGKVSFAAKDNATNESSPLNDDKVVVADNILPGLTVSYDNNTFKNEKYFDSDRTATIEIVEANFWSSDVQVFVNDVEEKFSFSKEVNGKEDAYVEDIVFDKDGDYVLYVDYSDRSGNNAKYRSPEFVIDKTAPVISVSYDNNTGIKNKYFNAARQATLTVDEHNFDPANFTVKVFAEKTDENNEVKVTDYSSVYEAYLKDSANWKMVKDDVYEITLMPFSEDGRYTFEVSFEDLAGNKAVKDISDSFIIDTTPPEKITIEYKGEPGNFIEKLFYKNFVEVTISAFDGVSGVNNLFCDYPIEKDASSVNTPGDNNPKFDEGTYSASHTFRIDAQYRGTLTLEAFDNASNDDKVYDSRAIVVDNIAPQVSVAIDADDGGYYNSDRKATITVNEANFWPQDVEIIVEKQLDSENEFTVLDESYEFISDDERKDTYVAEIDFNENADYKFDIIYTDRSGNKYDKYDEIEFTVDKIAPEITLDYEDDGKVFNENNYKTNRTAVITVKEHNFDPAGIDFEMTGVVTDENGDDITVVTEKNGYLDMLKDMENWTETENDVYVAKLKLDVDARYNIKKLSVKDLAGNESESLSDNFVIDKINPTSLEIVYEKTQWYENLFEMFSLGFYQSKTIVTIKAKDYISDLDYFTYSYKVGQGAVPGNEGKENQQIYLEGADEYSFEIPSQFRGQVTFTATDMAGNESEPQKDKNVVVVDEVAPQVWVEFDKNTPANETYYKADRTATITVKEANFWEEDIVITKGIRYDDADNTAGYAEDRIKPAFTLKEGEADVYVATVTFDENADYLLDISYSDKSGNAAVFETNKGENKNVFEVQEFTVDKILPEISITFAEDVPYNKNQYNTNRTATITVKEHNFDPEFIGCSITAKNKVNTDNEYDAIDISSKNYSDTLKEIENWTSEGNVHTITIDFDIDAQYNALITYTDLAGNSQVKEIKENFGVDKVAPSKLTIEYLENSVTEIILNTITFGFYKAPAKVRISAVDEISGVDYFTYSYNLDENVSSDNVGAEKIKIPAEKITRSTSPENAEKGGPRYEKATAEFSIPAQFRGKVSFFATDRANNESETVTDTDTTVVVDDVAPVISVEYDKYVENNHYTERKATITVKEANFFAEDVVIKIDRRLDNESKFSRQEYKAEFMAVKDSDKKDTYVAEIRFDEINQNADYIFDIDYTDKSGNVADDYTPDEFTIDVTNPEIAVSYDNNDVLNSDNFKADRTATIVIKEHNFIPADVAAVVTAKNLEGKDVEVEDYAAYLKKADSWTSEGDIHTAVIKFTAEADYTFGIEYTDQAGNKNLTVDYGSSAAPTKFTIDKTIPLSAIKVGDWTESKNGTKWDRFLNDISFSLWENETVKVSVESSDELSGLYIVEHFRSAEALTLAQVKASTEWTKIATNKTEFSYDVAPDERFIVYVHIVDNAGNEKYISSDGIIVDKTMPDVETIAPEVTLEPKEQPVNGIYSGDVNVDISVNDPVKRTVYSGLKSVTYEIYNNVVSVDEPTQKGTLFTYDITAKKQADLVQIFEKESAITVDCAKNNSNDITIKITATDNSDNVTVKTRDIKIDTTAPTIDISYDNNDADTGKFFSEKRTATVTVTERNFVPEDVKIDITNTDGKMPRISEWKKIKGTGNLDDTQWVATIRYAADGDYTFAIAYTDKAGLECKKISFEEGTVAAKSFTVDKTAPVVHVSYDNNNAANGNYFDAQRVATVVVDEHNFNAERVEITVTADNDGTRIAAPQITRWTSDGDKRTCNIYYSADAEYTFDIAVKDKAGNDSADYNADNFFVDKTDPEIEITNIENNSANSGKVAPVIRFSDTNFDRSKVKVVVTGANRGGVSPIGAYSDIHNGVVFSFTNFAEEKAVDDIYTINVSLTDMAGRTTSKAVTFSVNRFGSVYTLSSGLAKIIDKYSNEAKDIVFTETNPNRLSNIKLTLFKNNETIILEEGKDFKIDVHGGNGSWYRYVYTVFKSNFVDDGIYSLSVHSEDSAGNIAENTLDTKDTELNFGIDKTKPTINIKNVESNETYALDMLTVNMSAQDNFILKSVVVELDGVKLKEWSGKELKELIDSSTDMTFDVGGDSTSAHTIKVTAIDEAGNEQIEEVTDFYVTTNLWVRYYTNKELFYGSIAGVVLLGAAIVFIIVKKKKNDD